MIAKYEDQVEVIKKYFKSEGQNQNWLLFTKIVEKKSRQNFELWRFYKIVTEVTVLLDYILYMC